MKKKTLEIRNSLDLYEKYNYIWKKIYYSVCQLLAKKRAIQFFIYVSEIFVLRSDINLSY